MSTIDLFGLTLAFYGAMPPPRPPRPDRNGATWAAALVFSFDDEKKWRVLLDVRTQEVGVKPGWDEQPSQIATISESDGVRFHRYEDGRFVSFENVRRTAEELRAAAASPPLRSTPP